MLSTKYTKEYRLDTFTDKNGKVKDCTVYIGPLYEWAAPEKLIRKLGAVLSMLTALQAVLFVSSLWNYCDLSRLWWVVVPYCCLLFVFLYMAVVCFHLLTLKGAFHREQKDKTVDRMKGCSVMGAILSGITVISSTVSVIMGLVNMKAWDVWFVVTAAFMLIIFLYDIRLSAKVQVREVPNPKALEWKDK